IHTSQTPAAHPFPSFLLGRVAGGAGRMGCGPGLRRREDCTNGGANLGLHEAARHTPSVGLRPTPSPASAEKGCAAEIAIKASLTGHLVLSTLHTNDAPSTINRLMDMGVEPFLVATSVNVIAAQRLIRRVCGSCKV